MSSETELKLVPKRAPKEERIRRNCELGLAIRQCYLQAHGKRAPEFLRIRRVGRDRYLEITEPPDGRRGKATSVRRWRAKLSPAAWQRVKTKASVLRVRRSKVIKGQNAGGVFFEVTIKGRMTKNVERHEWERSLPRWAFQLLWTAGMECSSKRMLRKRRYSMRDNDRLVHVDFFTRHLKGLVVLEAQFKDAEDALRFQQEHGEKRKGRKLIYRTRPGFIDGSCLDVSHLKKAGCRSLAAQRQVPRFW